MIHIFSATAAQKNSEKTLSSDKPGDLQAVCRELSLHLLYYMEVVSCVSQMSEHWLDDK